MRAIYTAESRRSIHPYDHELTTNIILLYRDRIEAYSRRRHRHQRNRSTYREHNIL